MDTDSDNETHSDREVVGDGTYSAAEVVDDGMEDLAYEPPRKHRPTGAFVKTTPSERIKQERSTPRAQKRKVDVAAKPVCLIERVSRESVLEYCHVIRKKELDASVVIGHFSVLFSQLTFISLTVWSIIGACLDIH